MLFPVGRPISVSLWLAAPVLFAVAVLGLTALGGYLLAASWPVTLSSALAGCAAGVAAVLACGVTWRSPRQRVMLAVPYPVLLLLSGLVVDGLAVRSDWAMGLGVLAAVVLMVAFRPVDRGGRRSHEQRKTDRTPTKASSR